jgi:hypothetical protein
MRAEEGAARTLVRRVPQRADSCRTMHPIREARLRPQYTGLYPDLTPGVWVPANTLIEYVLERGLYRRGHGSPSHARLLDEEHFEFRGGSLRADQAWAGRPERLGEPGSPP